MKCSLQVLGNMDFSVPPPGFDPSLPPPIGEDASKYNKYKYRNPHDANP
jgi:hypothetical protein